MHPNKIIQETAHRKYPLPKKPWKYYQEWQNILLLHWKVDSKLIQRHVPKEVLLDEYEGTAWISLTLFSVKNIHPRHFPPLPFLFNFNEVNLRTYVIKDGKPGIYLFSIEASDFLPLLMTRFLTGLPYIKSDMQIAYHSFSSNNVKQSRQVNLSYKPTKAIKHNTGLEYWLTERHCLYHIDNHKIYRFDIHHKPWRLRHVAVALHDLKYAIGNYTILPEPDLKHYSRRLEVLFWGKKPLQL